MTTTNGRPQLLGPDGKPIVGADGFLLPPHRTFASIWQAVSRTYRFSWDEAVKDNRSNAVAMRRDVSLMEQLRERQLATAQLPWQLETDSPGDPGQKAVADGLTKAIERTPRLQGMLMNLLEAVWYGRYASQVVWGWEAIAGRRHLVIKRHAPLNGDKITFTWEGLPAILINASETIPGTLLATDRGRALLLDREDTRQRFVVHQHECDDSDYWEGEMAGALHGVGIRSRIYWAWWLRQEVLSWLMDYLERVGQGTTIFFYDPGNPQSEIEVRKAAEQYGRNTVICWPRHPDQKTGAGIDRLEVSGVGNDVLKQMMDYFDESIRKYIVGQTLSSDSASTGLGSGVAGLHADTKSKIIKFDANNLAETLTTDVVGPMKQWSYPDASFGVRFKFSVDEPDPKEKMEAAQKAWSMGAELDEEEVLRSAGLTRPKEGARILKQQAPAAPAPGGGSSPPPSAPAPSPPHHSPPHGGDGGTWEPFTGKHGGKGLRNRTTGDVRYRSREGQPDRYGGRDAAGHEHGDDGKFTGGGRGGGSKKGRGAAKKAILDKPLYEHGLAHAASHHQNAHAMLAKLKGGSYTPQDALDDIGIYHDRALARSNRVHAAHYGDLKAQAERAFGPEALASPEWAAVRQAFAVAKTKAAEHLEGMTNVVRANAEYYAAHPEEKIRIGTSDADALADHHNELGRDAMLGQGKITEAINAFVARYRPVQQARSGPVWRFAPGWDESKHRRNHGRFASGATHDPDPAAAAFHLHQISKLAATYPHMGLSLAARPADPAFHAPDRVALESRVADVLRGQHKHASAYFVGRTGETSFQVGAGDDAHIAIIEDPDTGGLVLRDNWLVAGKRRRFPLDADAPPAVLAAAVRWLRGRPLKRAERQLLKDYRAGRAAAPAAPDAAQPHQRAAAGPPSALSTAQFDLPAPLAARVLELARAIPDADLAAPGRETEPHLTVRYGLHTPDAGPVRDAVQGCGPVTVRFGDVSVFPAAAGADHDVLKLDVAGAGLRRLHERLGAALPHTDTHADYRPHVTLAYLRPGAGAKYAGPCALTGQEVALDVLTFADAARQTTAIPLVAVDPTDPAVQTKTRAFLRDLGLSEAAVAATLGEATSGGTTP